MKIQKSFFGAFALVFCVTNLSAAEYQVDDSHTNVNFEVDHLAFTTVNGRFDKFTGHFSLDDKSNALNNFQGTVQASSINTSNAKRDKHLRSQDFFEVEKFPTLSLKFTDLNIAPGKSRKSVKGSLQIRDVTKEIPFDIDFRGVAKDPWGTEKASLRFRTEINRKDFGLKWNEALETGGVLVGENVQIEINIQGNKVEARSLQADSKSDSKSKTKKETK